jgi:hypothetical protein
MSADETRTPEGCTYRQPLEFHMGQATHFCALAQAICGVADKTLFPVRQDECELCCRSNRPLPSAPNGLVASVTYKALRRVKECGGVEGCDARQAESLIPWVKRHFTVILFSDLVATSRGLAPPYTGPCRHLGAQTGERLCKSCRGQVWLKVFACSHPRHESTVIRECMACRDYENSSATPASPS